MNASITGAPIYTSADEEVECNADDIYAAITAGGEPSATVNVGAFFPVHDEYGYDWLQDLKAVGDWAWTAST